MDDCIVGLLLALLSMLLACLALAVKAHECRNAGQTAQKSVQSETEPID